MKVGINGFGRIGRCILRQCWQMKDFEITHINDLTDPAVTAHLMKYDSVHGPFGQNVTADTKSITVGGKKINILAEKDPKNLKWKDLGVDIVLECTGLFTDKEKVQVHMDNGAKKVIISAPAKGGDIFTVVMGVNEEMYNPKQHHILSNASCTTNCLAPMVKILHKTFKVKRGLMTTIHSYTNDQRVLDLPHKDLRRARAAALSMIPTTTGAAKAVGLVIPELKGKLNGYSMRVPTPNVSAVDLVAEVEKTTKKEEVNAAFVEASRSYFRDYLGVSEEPLVSSDFNGCSRSCTVDLEYTDVMDGNLVKVLGWYDNESGYSARMIDLVKYLIKKGF